MSQSRFVSSPAWSAILSRTERDPGECTAFSIGRTSPDTRDGGAADVLAYTFLPKLCNSRTPLVSDTIIPIAQSSAHLQPLFVMIPKTLLLALCFSVLSLVSSHAQLIKNGGFETGDFTDWDTAGTVEIKTGVPGSSFVHSGGYGATLGSGTLSQAFATTPGQTYKVEFLMNAILFQSPGLIEVRWGNFDIPANLDLGNVLLFDAFANPSPIPDLGWYKYSYSLLALGNVSSLQFEFQTQAAFYPDNAALDGVKVNSLPEFVALPPLNGVPIGDPSPDLVFGRPYLLSSSVEFSPVPEPSTYAALAALCLVALVVRRRFATTLCCRR